MHSLILFSLEVASIVYRVDVNVVLYPYNDLLYDARKTEFFCCVFCLNTGNEGYYIDIRRRAKALKISVDCDRMKKNDFEEDISWN